MFYIRHTDYNTLMYCDRDGFIYISDPPTLPPTAFQTIDGAQAAIYRCVKKRSEMNIRAFAVVQAIDITTTEYKVVG